LARKDRLLAILRAAAPVFAAALLGGWTAGTILAGVPAVLLATGKRPLLGLAITTLLEMVVVSRFGIGSFLTLLAVWLVWLPGSRYHAAGCAALAVAGACVPAQRVQAVLWSIALATMVMVAGTALLSRMTRMDEWRECARPVREHIPCIQFTAKVPLRFRSFLDRKEVRDA
jgi:hypothetical protein